MRRGSGGGGDLNLITLGFSFESGASFFEFVSFEKRSFLFLFHRMGSGASTRLVTIRVSRGSSRRQKLRRRLTPGSYPVS